MIPVGMRLRVHPMASFAPHRRFLSDTWWSIEQHQSGKSTGAALVGGFLFPPRRDDSVMPGVRRPATSGEIPLAWTPFPGCDHHVSFETLLRMVYPYVYPGARSHISVWSRAPTKPGRTDVTGFSQRYPIDAFFLPRRAEAQKRMSREHPVHVILDVALPIRALSELHPTLANVFRGTEPFLVSSLAQQ